MNNEQLHLHVLAGNVVTWADAYRLRLEGDRFVMERPETGERHSLACSETGAYRLACHWHGFTGRLAPRPDPVPSEPVAGDDVTVFRNQSERDGQVLAVRGEWALIVYEMPSGVTYLNLVPRRDIEGSSYRTVSRKALKQEWRDAVRDQSGPVTLVEKTYKGLRHVSLDAAP